MDISSLLAFTREVDRLKMIERKSLVYAGARPENSAEHSWHLAITVMAFHPQVAGKVDLLTALRMAILHDVVEIDAGDTFLYGDHSKKAAEESASARRIFGLLPGGSEWIALWERFEAKRCPESIFVGALDRFLPVYANLLNRGHAWKQHGITLEQVVEKSGSAIEPVLPELWAHLRGLLATAVAKGELAEKAK